MQEAIFRALEAQKTKPVPLVAKWKTEIDGLYLVGDFANGAETLVHAVGDGKDCAEVVDEFLMGRKRHIDTVLIEDVKQTVTGRTREMDAIPREPMPELPLDQRALRHEVELGLDEAAAKREAERCYLCQYKFEIDNELCIYCDRCLNVMPVDNCIVRISNLTHDSKDRITGYQPSTGARDYNHLYLDQNECIRCGACVEVCPVDCISLQRVSRCNVLQ
jgi:glutamate synthase (NADPH/NADH) small chain